MNTISTLNLPGNVHFSTAAENQHLLKSAAGRLLQVKVANSGPAQFLQLHDKAGAVVNGDIPRFTVPLPALGFAEITDMTFGNGIQVCNSTTFATATLGAADCWFYGEDK